jgi:hypothetical protein
LKLLILISIAFLISWPTSSHAQQQCVSQGQLKAKYKITVQHKLQNMNNNTKDTTLILWRKNNVVAHQYPSTQITEMWQKINDRLIKPIRFFNAHSRAIEYQPGEVVHGKKETDWSYRNQLISDVLLKSMQKVKTYGQACVQVVQLIQKSKKGELLIEWMPQLKLIKSFQFKGQQRQENWQLVELDIQSAKSEAYFDKLYTYQTTDYADIGDDHTDQFLTKMVTLGFVEAGSSGFYDNEENNNEIHQH